MDPLSENKREGGKMKKGNQERETEESREGACSTDLRGIRCPFDDWHTGNWHKTGW